MIILNSDRPSLQDWNVKDLVKETYDHLSFVFCQRGRTGWSRWCCGVCGAHLHPPNICGRAVAPTMNELLEHFRTNRHCKLGLMDMTLTMYLGPVGVPRNSSAVSGFVCGSVMPFLENIRLTWGLYIEQGMLVMFALLLLFKRGVTVRWGKGKQCQWLPSRVFDLAKCKPAIISYSGAGYYDNPRNERVVGAHLEDLPELLEHVGEHNLESWDGPIKFMKSGRAVHKVLLPLGRSVAGNWPVLRLVLTEEGWAILDAVSNWDLMRARKIIIIICLYQLLDKSEAWCIGQTWDAEGYHANNEQMRLRKQRSQQQSAAASSAWATVPEFEIMD